MIAGLRCQLYLLGSLGPICNIKPSKTSSLRKHFFYYSVIIQNLQKTILLKMNRGRNCDGCVEKVKKVISKYNGKLTKKPYILYINVINLGNYNLMSVTILSINFI